MKQLFFLFLISSTLIPPLYASLHPSRVVPEVRIAPNGTVSIQWETANPTARGIVFYAPDDGLYHQPFPHYFSRTEDKTIGKKHSVELQDIQPNVLYNYRVSCLDTVMRSELRSLNYTFKVIKRGEQFQHGVTLVEGPIVANSTPTSITLSWKTNLPTKGEVWYWTKTTPQPQKAPAVKTDTLFELTIEGLSKNQFYSYRVVSFDSGTSDTAVVPTCTFRTAPTGNASFKFVVTGDSRSGREVDVDYRLNGVNYTIMNRIAQRALSQGASFFLTSGDQPDGNTPERDDMMLQYFTWKRAVARTNAFIPFYPSVGNHDATGPHIRFGKTGRRDPDPPNSAEDLWKATFVLPTNGPEAEPGFPPLKETVYSFDYGNAHFVALNSAYFNVAQDESEKYKHNGFFNRITGPQLEWLVQDLKKAGDKLKFLYLHSPFFPAGGHIGSSLDKYPAERDSLWRIFERYNVTAVFAGHEHLYARVKVDKHINPSFKKTIYQVIAGGAGAPTYAQDMTIPYLKNVVKFRREYNYVVITVNGKHWRGEAFNENGEKIDEFPD